MFRNKKFSYKKFNYKNWFGLSVVAVMVAALTACAYTRATLDLDTDLELKFTISPAVNPDADGRASPIVLNLLYLKDNRQFEQEDFIALLQTPEERLGKDLIEKIRLKEFIPVEQRELVLVLPNDVRYVGVVAEYIQYQEANGKLILPIEAHASNSFEVTVDKASMKLD